MIPRRGFTLIELLVVIAIIAILAAILFPVFARARAKAQQTSCLSNVKQICLGYQMYFSDNDQGIPHACFGWGFTGQPGWEVAIAPYLKNTQILLDPSMATAPTVNGVPCNYVQNWEAGGVDGSPDPLKLDVIQYPTEMFLLACGGNSTGGCGGCGGTGGYGPFLETSFPHNVGDNLGFMDGHAKWMSQAAMILWPRSYPMTLANFGGNEAWVHFWVGVDL